jgi:hypothetical protein
VENSLENKKEIAIKIWGGGAATTSTSEVQGLLEDQPRVSSLKNMSAANLTASTMADKKFRPANF